MNRLQRHCIKRRCGSEGGFTLVELLVVMLILGVLAAIAIPAFILQKEKGNDAQAKVDAHTAFGAAETLATDNRGEYDGPGGVTVPNMVAVEATLTGADLSVPAVDAKSFIVRVTSSTGNTFDIVRAPNGEISQPCTTAGRSGCPEDGTWD